MALKHVLLIAAISGLVLGVPVMLATGAFTSATLEREATVEVNADSEGLLALRDGHANQDIVVEEATGTLAIDLTAGDAAGVNAGGTFRIGGKNSDPQADHAFLILHRGTQPSEITVKYELSGSDPQMGPNVKFKFYKDDTHVGTATEETATTINNVQPGDRVYVVIEIDTNGVTTGNDLSGALDISADSTT